MELFEDGQVNGGRRVGDKGHDLSAPLQQGPRSPSGVGSPAAGPGHEPESFGRRLLVWASEDGAEKPPFFSALSLPSGHSARRQHADGVGDSCGLVLSSRGLVPDQGTATASGWRSKGHRGLGSWLEDGEGEPPATRRDAGRSRRGESLKSDPRRGLRTQGLEAELPLTRLTPSSLPETLGTLRRVDHCLETTQATGPWRTGGQPVTPELMPRPQPTEGQSGPAARTRPGHGCRSRTPTSPCVGFSKTRSLVTTRYLKRPGYDPQSPSIHGTGRRGGWGREAAGERPGLLPRAGVGTETFGRVTRTRHRPRGSRPLFPGPSLPHALPFAQQIRRAGKPPGGGQQGWLGSWSPRGFLNLIQEIKS